MNRQWQRGLTRLEFAITVSVIGILIVVFLQRAELLQGRIETHTVRADIDAMRTAVTLARVRGDAEPGGNPVDLLEQQASPDPRQFAGDGFRESYAGTMDTDDPEALPPGAWVFLPAEGWLVYRIRRPGQFLDVYLPDPPRLRVRVDGSKEAPELRVEPDG